MSQKSHAKEIASPIVQSWSSYHSSLLKCYPLLNSKLDSEVFLVVDIILNVTWQQSKNISFEISSYCLCFSTPSSYTSYSWTKVYSLQITENLPFIGLFDTLVLPWFYGKHYLVFLLPIQRITLWADAQGISNDEWSILYLSLAMCMVMEHNVQGLWTKGM